MINIRMKIRDLSRITESAPVPPGFKLGRPLINPDGADVIFTKDPYEEYIIRFYRNGIHQPDKDIVTDDFNEVEDILKR
jgi:hypothetical protein